MELRHNIPEHELRRLKQGVEGKDSKQDPGQPNKQEETKTDTQAASKDKNTSNAPSKTKPRKKKSRKKR